MTEWISSSRSVAKALVSLNLLINVLLGPDPPSAEIAIKIYNKVTRCIAAACGGVPVLDTLIQRSPPIRSGKFARIAKDHTIVYRTPTLDEILDLARELWETIERAFGLAALALVAEDEDIAPCFTDELHRPLLKLLNTTPEELAYMRDGLTGNRKELLWAAIELKMRQLPQESFTFTPYLGENCTLLNLPNVYGFRRFAIFGVNLLLATEKKHWVDVFGTCETCKRIMISTRVDMLYCCQEHHPSSS